MLGFCICAHDDNHCKCEWSLVVGSTLPIANRSAARRQYRRQRVSSCASCERYTPQARWQRDHTRILHIVERLSWRASPPARRLHGMRPIGSRFAPSPRRSGLRNQRRRRIQPAHTLDFWPETALVTPLTTRNESYHRCTQRFAKNINARTATTSPAYYDLIKPIRVQCRPSSPSPRIPASTSRQADAWQFPRRCNPLSYRYRCRSATSLANTTGNS